jgi:hypothetical protein
MGRKRRDHVRISGRIDDEAADILRRVLERIRYGRKIPMGNILSKLICWTEPGTWQRIIKTFPPKRWAGLNKEIRLRSIEIELEERKREERERDRQQDHM